ncbi:hypothetical protein SPI_06245 [Niveomyces insectorum RCEF 264]|uniref:Uncharacterized protein n=1 Tax=Niveomyces insectorum RCEF 264 TaxID=1081102 RepID=A0A167RXU3_9HYPO|nr:hypothetical protein SPI_06245 [Niveomyces insectorum RCEF 264]
MAAVTAPDNEAASDHPAKFKARTRLSQAIHLVASQWLIIGIGVVCVLAYFFPNVAKEDGIIRSQYSILYAAVGIIFFVSGLSIPSDKLLIHLRNWRLHLLIQGTSYLFFPAFVLAVVHLVLATDTSKNIDRSVLAGYIFTAGLPTTISSNVVMTRAAHGDEAAALVEVVIANVLGPFISPGWIMALLPRTADFALLLANNGSNLGDMYKSVFKQLGISVLAPLAVGQLLSIFWSKQTLWCLETFRLKLISTACLLLLIWSAFSTCFATNAFETITPQCIAFIVLFNVFLYLLMTVICFGLSRPSEKIGKIPFYPRMPPDITIAVCFCGPAKTTALGIPLLHAMWKSADLGPTLGRMSLPVLLYTTEQVFVAHFVVYAFKAWLRKKEKTETIESSQDSV